MTEILISGIDIRPLAAADLRRLIVYIGAEAGKAAAQRYLDRIAATCRKLQDFPLLGQARSDLGSGMRSIAVERHTLIIYRPVQGPIQILRVVHGGQELPDQLLS